MPLSIVTGPAILQAGSGYAVAARASCQWRHASAVRERMRPAIIQYDPEFPIFEDASWPNRRPTKESDVSSAKYAGFRLAFAGLGLFSIGLGLGFVLPLFPAHKPLLSAHEGALGSGTFLISIGAAWAIFSKSESRTLILVLWLSHYALAAALIVNALGTAAHNAAAPLIGISCIAIAITTVMSMGRLWIDANHLRANEQAVAAGPAR